MTDKEFDVLLELSAITVDEGERVGLMGDMESILGYVSRLPVENAPTLRSGSMAPPSSPRAGEGAAEFVIDLRADEVQMPPGKEIDAVRKAFPATSKDGLLEVQDVFGSKDL